MEAISNQASTSTPPTTQATQVDLVRALESIDQSGLFGHHDDDDDDEDGLHDHTHAQHQQDQHDSTHVSDVPHGIGFDVEDDLGPGRELDGWTRQQLQAEIIKLRRQATAGINPSGISGPSANDHNSSDNADADHNVQAALKAVGVINASSTSEYVSIDPSLQPPDVALGSSHVLEPVAGDDEKKKKKPRAKRRRKGDQDEEDASVSEIVPKKGKASQRHEGTGKRLEKERRTELGRAIRTKIRSAIGVGMDDPLPHPNLPPPTNTSPALTTPFDRQTLGDQITFVPNWALSLNDEANVLWLNRMVSEIRIEGANGQYPKIPTSDFAEDIVRSTAKIAFTNMCKRYANENDPKGVERRDRYIKKRRRWARKDLKQKRRSRSAADPSFSDISLPLSALHIDYMSSEYSSSNEDEDRPAQAEMDHGLKLKAGRRAKWAEMRQSHAVSPTRPEVASGIGNGSGKGGWAVGISEKILEVRTPKWRSEALDNIYRRLDAFANEQADTRASGSAGGSRPKAPAVNSLGTTVGLEDINNGGTSPFPTPVPRAGHVAPSHKRFTMPPHLMRKGKAPRDLGEGWMWASGVAGVWIDGNTNNDNSGHADDHSNDFESLARVVTGHHSGLVAEHAWDMGNEHRMVNGNSDGALVGPGDTHRDTVEGIEVGGGEGVHNELEDAEAQRLGLVNVLQGL